MKYLKKDIIRLKHIPITLILIVLVISICTATTQLFVNTKLGSWLNICYITFTDYIYILSHNLPIKSPKEADLILPILVITFILFYVGLTILIKYKYKTLKWLKEVVIAILICFISITMTFNNIDQFPDYISLSINQNEIKQTILPRFIENYGNRQQIPNDHNSKKQIIENAIKEVTQYHIDNNLSYSKIKPKIITIDFYKDAPQTNKYFIALTQFQTGLIFLDKNVTKPIAIAAIYHELCHRIGNLKNETVTEFRATKIMIQSKNPMIKQIAINNILGTLSDKRYYNKNLTVKENVQLHFTRKNQYDPGIINLAKELTTQP